MARPITWQDIAPPNFASSLAASQAAGAQIGDALSGIAALGNNLREKAIEQSTREAVAQVQNAPDPVAVAAAMRTGWDIDPFVVSSAANARGTQLRQEEAANEAILTGKAQRSLIQGQADDRIAARESAGIASPVQMKLVAAKNFGQLQQAYQSIDRANPSFTGSQAGQLALKSIDDMFNERSKYFQNADELALRGRQIDMAGQAAKEAELNAKFAADLERAVADPKNAVLNEGALRDLVRGIAEKHDRVGQTESGVAYVKKAISGYTPTSDQLQVAQSEGGPTFGGIIGAFEEQKKEAESRANVAKQATAILLPGAEQDKLNRYKNMDDNTAALAILKDNPDLTKGIADWEPEDVIQRAAAIEKWAKDNFTPISREQAYAAVPTTRNAITLADGSSSVTDATRSAVKRFHASNIVGGAPEKERRIADIDAMLNATKAGYDKKIQQTGQGARAGDFGMVPEEGFTLYNSNPKVRRNSLITREIPALEAAVRLQASQTKTTADAYELQRLSAELMKAQAELAKLGN